MPRACADDQPVAVQRNSLEFGHVGNVDDVARPRQPLPHRQHQGLAARQKLRIGIVEEQLPGL
jgi:hypothetical protein